MARKRPGKDWAKGIKKTNDIDDLKLHILLWGPTGAGKTHFIKTAPRPFIIAPEDGLLTLHDMDIPYIHITEEMAVFDWMMVILDAAKKKDVLKDGEGNVIVDFSEIDTIAIDSFWKLNEMLLDELCEKTGKAKATFDEWGMLLTEMSKIVTKFNRAGYHTIGTVGEAIKADQLDEDTKVVEFNMRGSYRSQIAYEFDFNMYMEVKTRGARTEYLAHTKEENKRSAKSRVKMDKTIKDPSFSKLYEAVLDGLKK